MALAPLKGLAMHPQRGPHPPRRLARPPRARGRGVTLVELVVVISILGVVAGIGATLVGRLVAGQQANRSRLTLALSADAAMAQLADDLARALPNSLRLTSNAAGVWMELVPVLDAGRYRAAPDTISGTAGDMLDLGNAADNSFDVIGTPLAASTAGRSLVFQNLGGSDADAYSGNNRRAGIVLGGGGSQVSFTAAGALPTAPAVPRFFVVDSPVTIACVAVGGGFELRRFSGYGWLASQPASLAALSGGSNSLQLGGLLECSAAYSTALANIGLLNLRLAAGSTAADGQTTRMVVQHQLPVDNTP